MKPSRALWPHSPLHHLARPLWRLASRGALSLALVTGATLPTHALEIHVAPQGNDAWTGRAAAPQGTAGPVATLARARDLAREAIARNPAEPIRIELQSGDYVLTQTLVFDARDSRQPGTTTTLTAAPGAQATVRGAIAVGGWSPVRLLPAGVPAAAQGHLWSAPFPPAVPADARFTTLYDGEQRIERASSAAFVPQERYDWNSGPRDRLVYPQGLNLGWQRPADVDVAIRPAVSWTMNILPVKSVAVTSRTITTAIAGTYPLMAMGDDHAGQLESCWLENVPEGLDRPGRWLMDTRARRIYLWPSAGTVTAEALARRIRVPLLTELVRVDAGDSAATATPQAVRGLVFAGLTFTQGDRYTWPADLRGFQHDWAAVDTASALLRLRGASGCVVERCRFVNAGAGGVRIDLAGVGNRIEGNEFGHLGDNAVALCGPGPGRINTQHGNTVANNWIHHAGELYWHAAGIYIAQSEGNRIAHNLLAHLPFIGITISGSRDFHRDNLRPGEGGRSVRWQDFSTSEIQHMMDVYNSGGEPWKQMLGYLHARNNVIENNEIVGCVEKMSDGNAVYLSGAGTGNVIRRNYIHDLLGNGYQTGLRADDLQQGTEFSENIIAQCVWGAVQHKHVNSYTNNIFYDMLELSPEGRPWRDWGYFQICRGPSAGSVVERNVFLHPGGATRFYFDHTSGAMPPDHPFYATLEQCKPDHNLFWAAADPAWTASWLKETQARGVEAHSLAADPGLIDPARGDFRPRPDSMLHKLPGFVPLNAGAMGLEAPFTLQFFGALPLATRIEPAGGVLPREGTLEVRLSASTPGGTIHYTTDGSAPDASSPRYTAPLQLSRRTVLRAVAIAADGRIDPRGAAAHFESPWLIDEDFETQAVGLAPTTSENHAEAKGPIAVREGGAAGGQRYCELSDAPGQDKSYTPFFNYYPYAESGTALLRFALRTDAAGDILHEWRDWTKQPYSEGPSFHVRRGQLVVGDKELLAIPNGQWVRYEVSTTLTGAATQWSLRVEVPGQPARELGPFPCTAGFRRVTWVGFSSGGEEAARTGLDDLRMELRRNN